MSPSQSAECDRTVLAIVVLHNSAHFLPSLLRSLQSSCHVNRIMLVDNRSDDVDAVRSNVQASSAAGTRPEIGLVELPENIGFGAAINFAVRRAELQEELLLVLNPDIDLTADAIQGLVTAAVADSRAAAIAPVTMRDASGPVARRPTRFLNSLADLVRVPATDSFSKWEPLPSSGYVSWVEGSIVLLRSRCFMALGGFDESFFLYSEDEDLCRRLWAAGWAVRQIDCGETIGHQRGGSSENKATLVRAYYFSSVFGFLLKWYGKASAIMYASVFLATVCGRRLLARPSIADVATTLRLMRGWLRRGRQPDSVLAIDALEPAT